jgi:CheY-like chemotaxis protein
LVNPEASRQEPRDGPIPHVLVVEDDLDLRDLFLLVAQLQGYTAEGAINGSDGLSKLRATGASVVVLDLMMPVMTGWEFRERQLKDPSIANVPVLCVSAASNLAQHGERLHLPCMAKPVDPDLLAIALRDLCEHRSATPEAGTP